MEGSFWTLEHTAAALLLLGNLVVFPGLIMFWVRGGVQGHPPPNRAYFIWERGFIIGGIIFTAIGFLLLEWHLQASPGRALGLIGAVAYLVGGILGAGAEILGLLDRYRFQYPITVAYVILAFIGQAIIGAAFLQAGLLAGWIGAAAIIWNLAWLVALPLLTPRDIYFPVLHHVMPLIIGIALLLAAM